MDNGNSLYRMGIVTATTRMTAQEEIVHTWHWAFNLGIYGFREKH